MRSPLLLLGIVTVAVTVGFTADDKDDKQKNPQAQPPAQVQSPPGSPTITPRSKGKNPEAAESITDRKSNIRVDTTLVLIPGSVTDPLGRYVTNLDKENFKLMEEKVEQEISQFSAEDAPISVGVVFDASGSMGNKLLKSRQAVAHFMRTANPEDEFFLIQFNDRPELVVPFTPSTEEIQNRLTFVQSKGRTALLDGVYMAMNTMKKARNPRKAILIISDGGDNSSRYTMSEVHNAVRESDVQIYSIGIYEPIMARGRTPEEASGPELLRRLAEETGGRHFSVDNLAELPDVAAKIGIELRNQYVLGYVPKNASRDGKYRRVSVKLTNISGLGQLKPMFRTGYYAPTQ
jgi:Ca-activated chloride channel family protein